MNPELPDAIAAYFDAKNAQNTDGTLACFTSAATVIDEGESREMSGHEAIRNWLEGPIAQYKLTTKMIGVKKSDGETVVTALVSGDFPGSPIAFDYHFRLKDDKIDHLTIK